MSLQQGCQIVFVMALSRLVMKNQLSLMQYLISISAIIGVTFTVVPYFTSPYASSIGNEEHGQKLLNDTLNESAGLYNGHGKLQNESVIENVTLLLNVLSETGDITISSLVISALLVSCAAFNAALESVCIAATQLKEEDPVKLTFYYTTAGTVISLILMLALEKPLIPESVSDKLYMLVHSFSASSVSYLAVIAFQNANVNIVVIISSLRIPLAFVAQLLILNHSSSVNVMFLAGLAIVFVSAIVMPFYECTCNNKETSIS